MNTTERLKSGQLTREEERVLELVTLEDKTGGIVTRAAMRLLCGRANYNGRAERAAYRRTLENLASAGLIRKIVTNNKRTGARWSIWPKDRFGNPVRGRAITDGSEYGGVMGADGNIYSDADPGL